MKIEEVRAYGQLMDELKLMRLTVTEGESTICLEKQRSMGMASGSVRGGIVRQETETEQTAGEAGERPRERDGLYSVKSPMVGVFYTSPAENESPFVSVGDTVREGDVLCIIEAMKLMNEIRAEQSGVVEKVCVTNGQIVEYGTEIMRIRKE